MKYTVITLPQSDRNFSHELKDFEYNVHVGGKYDKARVDIIENNLEIMRHAVNNGDEWHTIIEDDVWFPNENCFPYYREAMANIPEDADVLLSCIYTGHSDENNDNLYWNKVPRQYAGNIFVAYSNNAMKKILAYHDKKVLYGDFDSDMVHIGLNIYVAKQFFAIQKDGYSFHHGRNERFNMEYGILSKIVI